MIKIMLNIFLIGIVFIVIGLFGFANFINAQAVLYNADLYSSCVSYYKMDDAAANHTVIDNKNFSNGSAQQNTSLLNTTGKVGGAFSFNGTSDFININNNLYDNVFVNPAFAINVWVNLNDVSQNRSIIGMLDDDHATAFELYFTTDLDTTILEMDVNIDADHATLIVAPNQDNIFNNWHMVTLNWEKSGDNLKLTIFLDGQLKNQGNFTGAGFVWSSEAINPYIGGYNTQLSSNKEWFSGSLDNFMIFNRAITSSEISSLYNSGAGAELLPAPLSTDATVTSTAYTVNSTLNTIAGIPFAASATTLTNNLTPASGATFSVFQSDGVTLRTGTLSTGDKVIVTAQDSTTTKTYILTISDYVAPVVIPVTHAGGTSTYSPTASQTTVELERSKDLTTEIETPEEDVTETTITSTTKLTQQQLNDAIIQIKQRLISVLTQLIQILSAQIILMSR